MRCTRVNQIPKLLRLQKQTYTPTDFSLWLYQRNFYLWLQLARTQETVRVGGFPILWGTGTLRERLCSRDFQLLDISSAIQPKAKLLSRQI